MKTYQLKCGKGLCCVIGLTLVTWGCADCDEDYGLSYITLDDNLPIGGTPRDLLPEIEAALHRLAEQQLEDHGWGSCPAGFSPVDMLQLDFDVRSDVVVQGGCGSPLDYLDFVADGTLTTSAELFSHVPVLIKLTAQYGDNIDKLTLEAVATTPPSTTQEFDVSECSPLRSVALAAEFLRSNSGLEVDSIGVFVELNSASRRVASWIRTK